MYEELKYHSAINKEVARILTAALGREIRVGAKLDPRDDIVEGLKEYINRRCSCITSKIIDD